MRGIPSLPRLRKPRTDNASILTDNAAFMEAPFLFFYTDLTFI